MADTKTASITNVDPKSLRLDPELQPRAEMFPQYAEDYAEWLTEHPDRHLPPVEAVKDAEGVLWVWDGFTRTQAYLAAGRARIPVHVQPGDRRQALLLSRAANATHGVRRTNQDKWRVVDAMLGDPEWAAWSDNKVAEACQVSRSLVQTRRATLAAKVSVPNGDPRKYIDRDGKERVMNTSRLGRHADDGEEDEGDDAGPDRNGVGSDIDTTPEPSQDRFGNPWPDKALDGIEAGNKLARGIRELLNSFTALLEELRETQLHNTVDFTAVLNHLARGKSALLLGKPYAVCNYCDGEGKKAGSKETCGGCRGSGWVNKATYDNAPRSGSTGGRK